jgi:integrase
MATESSDIHCPGDIDCETVVKVGKILKNVTDKQRNLVLCCLGDFVEYKTGYNPVKELRKNSWSLDFKPKTPQELSFLRDLDEFIADLRERGFRERSLQKRAMSTAIPYRFITEMYGPVYLQNIDYHMFREAAHSMTHLKQITIQGYLGLLGQLIEFCYGYNPNLQAGIVYSKQPVDRIFIDEGQWRKILAHATLTEKMILALAAGMGLRRMEIAYIHLSDIENGQLTIYGKGTGSYGKVTKMEIPDYVQEVMDHYMVYRRTLINPIRDMSEGRLLLNDKHCIGTPMDEYVVSHLVTALGDRAGVKVSCHVFRRLYCMTMFESGIEDDTIRRMMRHSYFSTTSDHYLSADPKRLTKARKSVGGLFA